jgi:hypothetical protein
MSLIKPGPAAATPLTRRQVLSRYDGNGGTVVAVPTSYGQLRKDNPDLGASSVIDPRRPVWVVTDYSAKPFSCPSCIMPLPAEAGPQRTFTVSSKVIDAATGQTTDYCVDCAAVTRSGRLLVSRPGS